MKQKTLVVPAFIVLVAALVASLTQPAQAVLLATADGSRADTRVTPEVATDVTFMLGYNNPSFTNADPLGTFVRSDQIGFDFMVPLNTALPFSKIFDATDPGFTDVAARLTNGVGETLFLGVHLL